VCIGEGGEGVSVMVCPVSVSGCHPRRGRETGADRVVSRPCEEGGV